MGKKRKTHSPQFKAKVALAAIQNDETTSHLDDIASVIDSAVPNL